MRGRSAPGEGRSAPGRVPRRAQHQGKAAPVPSPAWPGRGREAAAAAASRLSVTAPAPPGAMSGSGSEEPQPSQAAEDGQQEAERDWAAAKAYYDDVVAQRARPVSARGSGGRGEAGVPGAGGRGPALPCARSAAQAPERHHGGRVLPSTLRPGGGAEDLRRAWAGEVRGVPAEQRERYPQAWTSVLLRQGSREAARRERGVG